MGKEAELIKAAKTGDIRTLEKHLSHITKRTSVIGRYSIQWLHLYIHCMSASSITPIIHPLHPSYIHCLLLLLLYVCPLHPFQVDPFINVHVYVYPFKVTLLIHLHLDMSI